MTHSELHHSTDELNALLDGRMNPIEEKNIRNHLARCNDCLMAYEHLARVDAALRRVPVLKTSQDFTRALMARVLTPPASSVAFRLLERLPYMFGLLIVLGIMIASFVVTGVFDQAEIVRTHSVASEIVDKAGTRLAASIDTFTGLLIQYLPFAFGKGSLGVVFFAAVIILMLAAVDRVVGRKLLRH